MILSGQTIRRWCAGENPLISPFSERREMTVADFEDVEGRKVPKATKLSWGLGPAGYDVRVEFDARGERDAAVIAPGGFLLASTVERFEMPPSLLAEVKDKSSWARRGIALQNTVIEPGWRGWLTLEITNHSDRLIRISRGMPIAQIIFHRVDEAVELPYEAGKYQDQGRGPREAR